MEVMDIVEFIQSRGVRIYKVFRKDMSGVGLMEVVKLQGLLSSNLWLLIGLVETLRGVLVLGRG